MRMRHIGFVGFPALQYFAHYLINGTIFEKQLLSTKCVF